MNQFATVFLLALSLLSISGEGHPRPLPRPYYRTCIGIGLSGNWTLDSPRQTWVDRTTGLGFLQGFGGVIQAERPFRKWVSLTLETGYQHWQVKREQQRNGLILASTYKRLGQIPLVIGAKFFSRQDWYMTPQFGLHYLILTEWADSTARSRQIALGVLGALRVGRELRTGHDWLDISAGFQYAPVYGNPIFAEPFRYLSLRIIWKKGLVKPIRCP